MKIDSHQHFWKYEPVKDAWINEEMKVIKRDFLPSDVKPLLLENQIDGCVAVQADQSEDETRFLLDLAKENNFIKGVVGWVDLCAENIEERLEYYIKYEKLKGFRHIVQAEADIDFMLSEKFQNGISKLLKYSFTYDILISPKHLENARKLVAKFPEQKFVIDHLAKPDFKNKKFSDWEKDVRAIAQFPNVMCKVSGLVTEADWNNWTASDFTYCLDVVTEVFGIDRLMFGSDWPVSLLAASYAESCDIAEDYFSKFSKADQDKFWSKNAIIFYDLND
ncbi:L-fuconolactonase [Flavobacterium sp. 90]|uniref:amidohydrolase family protein n=1 Tax=unclassified Flavobacterium TaxID=196869 RepID=UPI000EAFCE8F|nr:MULTISPECIES: amidohydrolase family protein [unclassified Flavobacterium]RKR12063.1 L-fuconolactonase [Flavobacterium sp. 81]TCK55835.1 L-fuconolactonase [Flavobacterium sp. 90]